MTANIRILYAEDNPQDADQTRTHLAEHAPEFVVEIANTGQACLERLHANEFDLLLLDYRLPDMDGLEVLKKLLHTGLQLPVVLVTGVGDEDLVVKALRMGAADYVSKVGNYLQTLHELLHDVLAEQRRKQSQGQFPLTPRRILYVEHHPMDIELTLRHFAEHAPHFLVDVVNSCAQALARLAQAHSYDLALIDLRMPDQSGLELVHEAKCRHLPLPPFVVTTCRGDEATAIAALRLGATDYAVKREGYLDQLVRTIEHAIDYDQLNRLNQQLQAESAERGRAGQLLRESEDRYRDLVENSSDMVCTHDLGGNLLWVNRTAEHITGYSRKALLGMNLADLLTDGSRAGFPAYLAEIQAKGAARGVMRLRSATGEARWLEFNNTLRTEGVPVPVVRGMAQDVTERRKTEAELRRRTDELALHNQILRLVSDNIALPAVLDHMTRQVDALHPGMLSSILLLDEDGLHLRIGAAPGLPDSFNQAIDGLAIGDGVGSCGTAAYGGERVVAEDLQQHPHWAKARDLARQAGVQSCWSQPIKSSKGGVLGTFAIYHRQPRKPSEQEIRLIETFASLAALAIEHQRGGAEIARQIDELRRWQAVMLDREDRNTELKREINGLLLRLGEPIRYASQAAGGSAAT